MTRTAITHIRQHVVVAALLFFAIMFAPPVFSGASPLSQSTHPGFLVYTDFLKPDQFYTVVLFDLEQNVGYYLSGERYDDIGVLYPIDDQHVYASICFAQNNPMFCSAGINGIISPEQVSRFDVVKPLWKENYGSPVWSPEGTHVAFIVSSRGAEDNRTIQGDLYVMNADGADMLDLTPDEDNNGFDFTWSPDSRQIAFACHDEQYLCITNADGSDLKQIDVAENTRVRDVSWSPHGSLIAFSLLHRDFQNAELYVVNADGSGMARLLEAGSNFHENPIWSPDGSKIVFRAGEQRNNIGEIYVIEPNGANLQNLTQRLDGNEFGATWSPDSSQIAFFSHQDDEGMFLYIANVDGTGLHRIAENSTWELTDAGSPYLFWLPQAISR
jgi:dipeptidyl aminopeptidase/acylaminoacyl peptidase